jgi:hypothetical protein
MTMLTEICNSSEFMNNSTKTLQKIGLVSGALNDHLELYSTNDDMMQGARCIYAGFTRKGVYRSRHKHNVNIQMEQTSPLFL